jgi:hypothetical protein
MQHIHTFVKFCKVKVRRFLFPLGLLTVSGFAFFWEDCMSDENQFSRKHLCNSYEFSRKHLCTSCESREKVKMRYFVKRSSLVNKQNVVCGKKPVILLSSSCSAGPVQSTLFYPSCSACPVLPISSACPVVSVPFYLSGCTVVPVPFCLSFLSWLSWL